MADLETILNLVADADEVVDLVSQHGGALFRDEADRVVYWVALRPPSMPDEVFYVRLAWTTYPGAAPSVKFATEVGGRLDVTAAWPMMPGYRPGCFDICKPMSAEGYAVHPEWMTGAEAWRSTGNPFAWVISQLIADFTNDFQERSA